MTQDIELPPDLADAIAADPAARQTWDRLPPSHRREYIEAVAQAKRAATRTRRIEQAIARLADPGRDTRLSQQSTRPLAAKIGVKPGTTVTLLNAEFSAAELLDELPEGASVSTRLASQPGFVLLFVRDSAELAREWDTLRERLEPTTTLWIAYPKKTGSIKTDLTRDRGWDILREAGWQGVNLVAVDDTWSAMRYMPVTSGQPG